MTLHSTRYAPLQPHILSHPHLHTAPHRRLKHISTPRYQIPHLRNAVIISLGGVPSLPNRADTARQEQLLQTARLVQRARHVPEPNDDDDAPNRRHGAGPAVCYGTSRLCPLRAFSGLC